MLPFNSQNFSTDENVEKNPLIQRVLDFIQSHTLFSFNDRCIISFSGGPDSVFLLTVLRAFMHPNQLLLVYFDHGLRCESTQEIDFVKDLSAQYKIPCIIRKIAVNEQSKYQKKSVETMGRILRQEALLEIAEEQNYSIILTAHHLDDDCEGFIHKFIRGARTHLRGMQVKIALKNSISFIRPLLGISKKEILDFLSENNIFYCQDDTNFQNNYTRNRIRNLILPQIETINPAYRRTFSRNMRYFEELDKFLATYTDPILDCCHIQENEVSLEVSLFRNLHSILRKRIIFLMLLRYFGPENEVNEYHVQWIENAIDQSEYKRISLPHNTICKITPSKIIIQKSPSETVSFMYTYSELPAVVEIKEINQLIVFSVERNIGQYQCQEPGVHYLNFEKINERAPIIIRSRQAKDSFQPFGCTYMKRLKKYFIDKKIFSEIRSNVPLLFIENSLVCILGYQISESMRVTPQTARILKVSISKV